MPRVDLTEDQLAKLEALLGEKLELAPEPTSDPAELVRRHQLPAKPQVTPCEQCGQIHDPNNLMCRCLRCGQIGPVETRRGTVVMQGRVIGMLCITCMDRQ